MTQELQNSIKESEARTKAALGKIEKGKLAFSSDEYIMAFNNEYRLKKIRDLQEFIETMKKK